MVAGGLLFAASVRAGQIEQDWARQDQMRGRPIFAGWSEPAKTLRQSVVPSIDEHLARGRMLIEDAHRRASSAVVSQAKELNELSARRDKLLASGNEDPAAWQKLYLDLRWAVRRIVFADPAWDFDKLLFVKRLTYTSSHIYTDHYDGSSRFGGDLCILSPIGSEGKVTEIAPALKGGIFGRFDLSFDAKRVVFAHKKPGKGYRIHEVNVDGSGLRPLTDDEPDEARMEARYGHGYDDLDPCYLPGGRIAFTSTRSKRAVICTHNFTSTAIHVMDASEKNLRCLSGNTVNEFAPTAMHDGRILYTRWEYVDKGAGDVQSLWSMHPDGSYPARVYKNNVPKPPTLIDARQLPGKGHLFVCTGAPHMPLAIGPVMLVDIHKGQLNPAAMTNLTPEIALPLHYGYAGMTGIQRGRVKYVCVMEDVPKPWEPSWCSPEQGDTLGLQNPAISLKGHFVIKRVHGVVPVNDDGSAVFTVPSGKNLYFQAIDANYMELQRMRTFVNLMPGEKRSCIGCHESRTLAPSPRAVASLTQPPRDLGPQPGETVPRVVHFPLDVQPSFDKHCVRCHNAAKVDGGVDLSAEMTELFSKSYENLIAKGLINHIDSDPRDNYIPAEPPLTFGSHKSKVVQLILVGHYDCKLSREEFVRLVTWIDANTPYYGVYEGKKNLKWKGEPDFRPPPSLHLGHR